MSVEPSLSLMEAARIGNSAIVQQHLEQGVDTDTLNRSLIEASRAGHSDVVKLLLDNGAQIDLQNNGVSSLIVASQNGHSNVVKLLLDNGAQVNLKNNDGSSSLMLAIQNGHCDVVKMLYPSPPSLCPPSFPPLSPTPHNPFEATSIESLNTKTQSVKQSASTPVPNYDPPPPVREPPPSFQSTAALEKQREAEAAAMWPDTGLRDGGGGGEYYPYPYPTPPNEQDLEADLQGKVIKVALQKTTQGFGFAIITGDIPGGLLQIKRIVQGSVAERDGRLIVGDVLVRINGISVLTYSHRKVVELVQSLTLGSDVSIEVRRGYPLPDGQRSPDDLLSYMESSHGYNEPQQIQGERVLVNIIKGPLGFGFSLGKLYDVYSIRYLYLGLLNLLV